MANLQHAALKGTLVRFYVRDIHIPQPTAVLQELHRGEQMRGRVLDVSDSGTPGGVFLVIEVDGFKQLCILPADRALPMV
jgi:hypothetical protein